MTGTGRVPDARLPRAADPEAVPVREAATIALVRDAERGGGLEVFLQHRVSTMQFAANMTVFPGGGVEERDRSGDAPWAGPDVSWWAEAFSVTPDRAGSAVRAAVRELFEETGVLLAHGGRGTGPGPEERRTLVEERASLDEVLTAHGMTLAADRLRPWDRWTTPLGPPRRYDTLFFVAALPEGAEPDGGTTEARAAGWMRVSEALEADERGELVMLPPTLAVLGGLVEVGGVDELLATKRYVRPGGN